MSNATRVYADIEALSFDAVGAIMCHEADEHGLPILKNTEEEVCIQSPLGRFGIVARAKGLRLYVDSESDGNLMSLREGLVDHVAHHLPGVARRIRWSDAPRAGDLPANFQFATVVSKVALCTDFFRLVLMPDRPQNFGDGSIHFRFALPSSQNDKPVWPRVGQNGSIIWPEREKALHRPVYTARSISVSGEMTVDVFRHHGGRVTDWAAHAKAGDRVAIIGPGGSGLISDHSLIMGADETAYPAVSRILESLPAGAKASVFLKSHRQKYDYPIPCSDQIAVHWLTPETPLAARVLAAFRSNPDSYVWFASEATEVKALRQGLLPMKPDKKRLYIAIYWTKHP